MKRIFLNILVPGAAVAFLTLVLFRLAGFMLSDNMPPAWDYADHLNHALGYYNALRAHDFGEFFRLYAYYPPLTYWLLSVGYMAVGYGKFAIILLNCCFLFLYVFYICRMAGKHHSPASTGMFVIFSIGLLMVTTSAGGRLYEFMLDIPAGIWTVLCFFYALQSIEERRFTAGRAVMIAVLFSLAALTKWHTIMYLFIPVVYYALQLKRANKWGELLLFSMLVVYGSGWWYVQNRYQLYPSWYAYTANQSPVPLWSYVRYVIRRTPVSLFWIVPASVYVVRSVRACAPSVLRGKKTLILGNKLLWIELFTILFSLLPYCLLRVKDPRFLYPGMLLLGISIYRHIFLKREVTPLVFVSICLYTAFGIATYFPKPNSAVQTLDVIREYLAGQQKRSVGFYFEEDTATANFDSVLLTVNELNSLRNAQVQFRFMNSYLPGQISACIVDQPADSILVYANTASDSPLRAPFEENCPAGIRKRYRLSVEYRTGESDTIKVYSRL